MVRTIIGTLALRRCEVVEHTEQVTVGICGGELVKTPRLRFGCGQQNGVGRTPRLMESVNLGFAAQVEPHHYGTDVATFVAERETGEE